MGNGWICKAFISLACSVGLLFGQAKAPQPKSQKEVEAIQAIFAAQDPDSQIKAAEELIQKFADTEFKGIALFVAANAYQNKNDSTNAIIYAERMLEVDKTSFQAGQAMTMIAKNLAIRTREFDLDKEEKLTRAEKMANEAQTVLSAAAKPRPDIPDDQWDAAKKDALSAVHESLALVAQGRKKNDVAVAEYKLAIETASPDPATMIRLASLYNTMGKHDDAIVLSDKILALPDLHPTIKQFATQEKDKAVKAKSGAK